MTPEALGFALLIFVLRVVNNTISTIRLVVLTRDRRLLASSLAFIESALFVVIFGSVVTDLDNVLNVIAYAGGFAVGGYVGQTLEAHFISGYVTVQIIPHDHGHDIAVAMRAGGYGVTETLGEGGGGLVAILRSVILRKDVARLLRLVREYDREAFVTVEETRAVHRGYIKAARNQHRS